MISKDREERSENVPVMLEELSLKRTFLLSFYSFPSQIAFGQTSIAEKKWRVAEEELRKIEMANAGEKRERILVGK